MPNSISPTKTARVADRAAAQNFGGALWQLTKLIVLSVAGCAVYARAIHTPFIFDDSFSVTENPSIAHLWPLVGNSEHPGVLNPPKDLPTSGRPLVSLSLALNYRFGGYDSAGYHLVNLVVHLLSALLLASIVERSLRLEYFGGRFDGVAQWLSLGAALLWVVHPLHTETVVYITQRTELLVGFFYLASLYGSLRYWAAATSNGRAMWLTLSTLACLAGAACKEVMVTATVVILLFDRTFISGSFRKALRNSWSLYLGLASAWLLLAWLNYDAPRSNSAGFNLGVPAVVWWLTQTKVIWMYFRLVIWPWPLALHYELPYLVTVGAAWPWMVFTVLLGIVTLVLVWRCSAVGFAMAWVLIVLSPTLVVPIVTEVAAERRMYLPLASLTTLFVVGGYSLGAYLLAKIVADKRWTDTDRRKSIDLGSLSSIATITLILTVAFSLVSVRRLAAYTDSMTMWRDVLANQPNDYLAHTNLGNALYEQGQSKDAILEYEQALRLNPNYQPAHNNLGALLIKEVGPEQAMPHLQEALRLKPNAPEVHNNIGFALYNSGKISEAIEQWHRALALFPDYAEAHFNLAIALDKIGQPQQAIDHFQKSLELSPGYVLAHYNLGNTLFRLGRSDEAMAHYRRAIQLRPNYSEAYNNLGNALMTAGRTQEAINALRKALEFTPDYAAAHYNLAKALGESGNSAEAIEHYQKAVKLNPDYPEAFNNLATMQVNTGQLEEAFKNYQQAIRLRPDSAQTLHNLGALMLKTGHPKEALTYTQRAIELNADYLEAYADLATANAQLSRPEAAIAAAGKALELARGRGLTETVQQIENWLKEYRASNAQGSAAPQIPATPRGSP